MEEIKILVDNIKKLTKKINKEIKIMEVCGTHTVSIFRNGIKSLIPKQIQMLSGPGCPVCVTPAEDIDTAIELSMQNNVILVTFGDMMKVPGSNKNSFYNATSEGADIRVIYSPMEVLRICKEFPDKKIIFFSTGFETTSPSVAAIVLEAEKSFIKNLYIYSCHRLIPPALRLLLDDPEVEVDGFMLPGHVSAIIGSEPYKFIASEFKKPAIITGFEGIDILQAILMILIQILKETPNVEIQYSCVVKTKGNKKAIKIMKEVFSEIDADWRGIGKIPKSGLDLKDKYAHRNAKNLIHAKYYVIEKISGCKCGDILKGKKTPKECPLFGKKCTPENPVGACMVSTEGSCAAYYRYS